MSNQNYENETREKRFTETERHYDTKVNKDTITRLQNLDIEFLQGDEDQSLQQKRLLRKEKRIQSKQQTEGQMKSDYMPVAKELFLEKEKRKHNRAGYKSRKPFENWNIPIFDLQTKVENPYDRLHLWNKKHKCEHGLRYNKMSLKTECRVPHYEPSCDHKKEQTREVLDTSCPNCSQRFMRRVYVREELDCTCLVTQCDFCKYRLYTATYHIPDREQGEYKEREIKTSNIVCCCIKEGRTDFAAWKSKHVLEKLTSKWTCPRESREEFFNELKGIKTPATEVEILNMGDFPTLESSRINSGKATGGVVTKSYSLLKSTAQDVLTHVQTALTGVVNKFEKAFKMVRDASEVKNIYDKVKTFLLGLAGTVKELLVAFISQPGVAISAAIHLYKFFTEGGKLNLIGALGTLITVYVESEVNFFSKLFEFILDYFDDHATAGEENLVTRAFAYLNIISSKVTGTVIDFFQWKSTPTISNFIREFNSKVQFGRSLGTIFYKLISLLPSAIKCIFVTQSPEAALNEIITSEDNPVGQASRKAVALKLAYAIGEAEDIHVAEHHMTESYAAALTWIKEKQFPYSWTLMRYMDSLQRHVKNTQSSRDLEKEPFIIRITGDAGVGKSTLAPYLLRGLYPNLSMKDIRAKIYTRNPLAEHWDGWNNAVHEIVMYDDFGQSREELDFFELILLASTAVYRPSFANIDPAMTDTIGMKGTVVNPKIIILCSNIDVLSPKHLTSTDAINRRQHVHVNMRFNSTDLAVQDDFSHCDFSLKGCEGKDFKKLGSGEDAVNYCTALVEEVGKSFEERLERLKQKNETMKYVKPVDFAVPEDFKSQMRILSSKRTIFKRNETTLTRFVNTPRTSAQADIDLDEIRTEGKATSGFFSTSMEAITSLATKLYPSIVSGMHTFNTVYFFGDAIAHLLTCNASRWNILRAFAAGITGILAFKGVWDLVKTVATSGHTNTAKYVAPKVGARASGAEDQYFKFIANNCAYIRTGTRFQNCMYVRGNVIMFNLHFLTDNTEDTLIPEDTEISITEVGKESRNFPFKRERMYIIPDKDMVLYHLPIQFQQKKDIVNHFTDGTGSLVSKTTTAIKTSPEMVHYVHSKVRKDQVELVWIDDRGYKHYGRDTFTVEMPAPDGDCGSPVVLTNNTNSNGRIIGIVTASVSGGHCTSCQVITRDMIEKGLTAFDMPAIATSGLLKKLANLDVTEHDDDRVKGDLRVFGKIDYFNKPPTKTKIVKSPLYHEIVTTETKPARLYIPGRDLVMEGINKYAHPPKDLKHIDHILETQLEIFDSVDNLQIFPRMLTWEEVVNGVIGFPYIDSMDMSTSVGFPLVMDNLKKKDLFLWNEDTLRYTLTKKMLDDLQVIEEHLSQGFIMDLPFVGTLKDERRPIEKVDQGKTRYFSASSLYNTMFLKRYFAPLISMMFQSRHESYVKVGIDKVTEWDELAKSLLSVNKEVYDCDYTAFDAKLCPNVAEAWIRFVLTWMTRMRNNKKIYFTDKDFTIMRTLMYSDANPVHLVENMLIMISSGNSSGSYFTTAKNCFANVCYLMESWIESVPNEYKDLKHFRQSVSAHVFGDDLIFSVDPYFSKIFNDQAHSQVMERYGITVTTANKDGTFGAKPITEVQFLKHKFVKIRGMYYPLQMAPFEQVNWVRKGQNSPSAEEACELNCNAALYAAFFHGPEIFNHYRSKILEIRPKYNLVSYRGLAFEFNATGKLTDLMNVFGYSQHSPNMEGILDYQQTTSDGVVQIQLVKVDKELIDNMIGKATSGNKFLSMIILKDRYHGIWIQSKSRVTDHIQQWMLLSDESRRFYTSSLQELIDNHHERDAKECEFDHDLCRYHLGKQINNNNNRGRFDQSDWTWLVYVNDDKIVYAEAIGCTVPMNLDLQLSQISEKPQDIWNEGIAKATSGNLPGVTHEGGNSGTLDEAVEITTTQVGVHLSEQKEATPVIIPGGFSTDVRSQKYNNDVNWDLEKTQQRYNLVEQIKWQATDGEMTLLRTYDVMKDLIKNDLMGMPFDRFHAFRCKTIRLRFEVIGYRFCNGSLMAWFERSHIKKETNKLVNDKIRITQLNPAFILPNAGTVVDMAIPFNFHRQYLNLNDADTMGQLKIVVNSPFESVDGSNTYCIVKLYVQIEGAEFRQPKVGLSESNRNQLRKLEKQMMASDFLHIKTGKATSGLIDGLIDSGAGELKKIVKNIVPDDLVADVLDGLLDAPQIADQPHFVEFKPTQFLSNVNIPRYMENLTYNGATIQLTDGDIASIDVDEMSFSHLFERWSHVGQFDITTTSSGNLFKKIIGPNARWFNVPVPHTAATSVCPTIMDFVASHFEYWRGGTELKIKAFCSPMHEFKLTIYYVPWIIDTDPEYDQAQLSTQYFRSHVFRNEDNEVTVVLPDLGDTPVRKVYQGQNLADVDGLTGYRSMDYFVGHYRIELEGTINFPASVPPNARIEVYERPAKDFEVFMTTLTGSSWQPSNIEIGRATSGSMPVKTLQTPANATMLAAGGGYKSDVKKSHFGEKITSFKDMLKRFNLVHESNTEVTLTEDQLNGTKPFVSFLPVNALGPIGGANNAINSVMGRIAPCYRSIRGGLSFKIAAEITVVPQQFTTPRVSIKTESIITPVTNIDHMEQVAEALELTGHIFNPVAEPSIISRDGSYAEFRMPFMQHTSMALLSQIWENNEEDPYTFNQYFRYLFGITTTMRDLPALVDFYSNYRTYFSVRVFMAFNDETRLLEFVGTQPMYLKPSTYDPTKCVADSWNWTVSKDKRAKTKANFLVLKPPKH